ncbi:hypothetical protein A3731_10270 [Roseovarius sp. HI0049]|nr:hypothetical protein A3731_10270 [Roseovarius sp. HI0049]
MTGWIARTLVALIVALGLLVPQGAGVAAALGLTADRVMVICTGDGLRTLRFDADGNPVEVSETPDTCALVHATDTATPIEPAPAAHPLIPAPALLAAHPFQSLRAVHSPSLPRAPPAA